MKRFKSGFLTVAAGWPILQYLVDWYREPGPMLPWVFLNQMIGSVWIWVVLVAGLWMMYDALKGLSE